MTRMDAFHRVSEHERAEAEAAAKEQRELHDAYDKHEIHVVAPFGLSKPMLSKFGNLENIQIDLGQCVCGRAFYRLYHKVLGPRHWVRVNPFMARILRREGKDVEDFSAFDRLFKYVSEVPGPAK